MLDHISKVIRMMGGPVACIIIALCIADVILNIYSRKQNSKAARLW